MPVPFLRSVNGFIDSTHDKMLDEYEVDEDVAKTDLDEFLTVLKENEII